MVSKAMLSSLLQKQYTYTPISQPLYTFVSGIWRPFRLPSRQGDPISLPPSNFHSLHLITWNIDFVGSYPRARMSAALTHLSQILTGIPATSAVVIFLQEMKEDKSVVTDPEQSANDLTQLQDADWVQKRFHMTDIDSGHWNSPRYGTVTLVDRRLRVEQVARLPFVSRYGRDALFVDVRVAGGESQGRVLRMCNVHLDSMTGSMRPIQWNALARLLQPQPSDSTDSNLAASIVAGDCNANRPRDWTEPQNNGFRDAYLEIGGVEGDEAGATWGFQSTDWKRWGRKRLDKIVCWGDLKVSSLERVGIDVRVEEESVARGLERLEQLPFATDHFGLMGEFLIEAGLETTNEA